MEDKLFYIYGGIFLFAVIVVGLGKLSDRLVKPPKPQKRYEVK